MKFDLKALLAILTVAASVLAGIAGVVWLSSGWPSLRSTRG